jgi:hypothetical protein
MAHDAGPIEERLSALQSEVARLSRELESAREALAAQQASPRQTMRGLLECPHCSGRRVYHIRRVLDRGDANSEHHFSVTTKGFWSPKPVGRFACWVCAGCGFTEWYVSDPQSLEVDDETIELIEIEPGEGGPYR